MSTAVFEGTRLHGATVRLVRDDITELDVDAFVFYASHDLILGSGHGTAISVRGGPSIQKELKALAPLETGQAAVTGAGNLKAKHIVHAVGPRFREPDLERKLRSTMDETLRCARRVGARSLALPAMGAGYYGIPTALCARVMLQALDDHLRSDDALEEVVVSVLDTPQWEAFRAALEALDGGKAR